MAELIEITTTLESENAARELARKMIEWRLVACVQIVGPITSYYRWADEVQEGQEWKCTMKSVSGLQSKIIETIRANHPYQVPEILVTPVLAAGAGYRDWLLKQVESSIT